MRDGVAKWVLVAALLGAGAVQAQAVRPEIGKPLQAAQELIKAQKYKDALAKVREADAVGGKTAAESTLIERMRIAAASGAGDVETAAKSFEAIGAQVSAAERLRMIESLAGGYYRAQNYAKAMQWGQRYFKEGGTSASIRTLLIQSQYLSGDFAGAAKELTTEIQQAEKAGQPPGEDGSSSWSTPRSSSTTPTATCGRWSAWSRTTRRRTTGSTCSDGCSASPTSATGWRWTPTG
jgi:hypothetical protein